MMNVKIKNIILLLFALSLAVLSNAQSKKYKKTYKKRKVAHKVTPRTLPDTNIVAKNTYSIKDSNTADSLFSFAKSHLGIRYCYGGVDARGFDCSGFVLYCFKHFGYKLPHEAGQQMKVSNPQTEQTAKKGDIIFFGYYNKKTRSYYISHSGIVASTDGGKIWFIHSASHAGIRLDCLDQGWYRQRFAGIGRVIEPKVIATPKTETEVPFPTN
ncbi:MAG: C40 family peptidase [Bacteroidota bacterium]|nr:C40 family peptidase [Bacteroidota bacterium]